MKKVQIIITMLIMLIITGCSATQPESLTPDSNVASQEETKNEKPVILTSFYPIEEITKAIVKDTADVNVLVGSGVEPHSFEPTPQQLVEASKSSVFVTVGGMFEHFEHEIEEANEGLKIIDAAHNAELIKGEEHDHHDDHHDEHEEEGHDDHAHEDEHSHEDEEHHDDHSEEHDDHAHEDEHSDEEEHSNEEEHHEDDHGHDEHNHGEYDPHIWLSIHNMEKMTNEIVEHLVEMYPENKELYESNANEYIEQLEQLETEYNNKLTSCANDKIIVNHKAFGYLAHEYNFEQISVAGFSPESEPTPKTIQTVIDEAKEHNLTYVFSEGQIDSKTADTIANDIGGEVLELNPLRMSDDENYFSIMRSNLDNLALGLNCQN